MRAEKKNLANNKMTQGIKMKKRNGWMIAKTVKGWPLVVLLSALFVAPCLLLTATPSYAQSTTTREDITNLKNYLCEPGRLNFNAQEPFCQKVADYLAAQGYSLYYRNDVFRQMTVDAINTSYANAQSLSQAVTSAGFLSSSIFLGYIGTDVKNRVDSMMALLGNNRITQAKNDGITYERLVWMMLHVRDLYLEDKVRASSAYDDVYATTKADIIASTFYSEGTTRWISNIQARYVALNNVAPTATNLSAAENYTEDTTLNLIDIVASDVDNATVTATLTLSDAAAGSLSTATSGAVTSTYNAGTGVWSANGAIADVNTLLAGLTFTPALNFYADFTIATSVSDGSLSVTGSKAMTGAEKPSLVVTIADDTIATDGETSLREAITFANSDADTSIITFDIDDAPISFIAARNRPQALGPVNDGPHTITLNSALPNLSTDITIDNDDAGAEAVTVARSADAGTPDFSVFKVSNASKVSNGSTVTISGLTISNGNATEGGGINIRGGTVNITNCTISDNTASGGQDFGGQISGGGIYIYLGMVNITNSTISGNTASGQTDGRGGGIYNNGGTLAITSSTISGNTASGQIYGIGGGIYGPSGTVSNSIIAGNTATYDGPDIFGNFTSQGYNLIGKNDGGSGFTNGANNDQVGSGNDPRDAMLGDLADNGGPTWTHALLTGSPALDAGQSDEATDQRGILRPQGAADDIGAFEVEFIQPDLLVKQYYEKDAAYGLNDIYQSTPSGAQIESLFLAGAKTAFRFKIQNDSSTARAFVLKATESDETGWALVYTVGKDGKINISAAITSAAGFTTATLAPGESQVITLGMTRDAGVTGTKTVTLNAFLSGSDTVVRDAVRAIATGNDFAPTAAFTNAMTTPVGTTPVNNGTVYNRLPVITGTAADADSGVAKVELQLYRASSTAGVDEYWNGSAWIVPATGAAPPRLTTSISPTGGGANVSWGVNVDPPAASFGDGVYFLRAFPTDKAGRQGASSTVRFTKATDAIAPTVSFTTATTNPAGITPANNGTSTEEEMPVITGVAADAGSGIAKVELQLYRASLTPGVNEYWNGTEWIVPTSSVPTPFLSTGLSPAGGGTSVGWSKSSGFPTDTNFENGIYFLRAFATDGVGKRTASSIIRFTQAAVEEEEMMTSETQGGSTPSVSAQAAQSSDVKLSSAVVHSSGPSIELAFSGALDSKVAQEVEHYTVEVNGVAISIESATYNAATKTVTLGLPSTSLKAGADVSVLVTGLRDGNELNIADQSADVVAR